MQVEKSFQKSKQRPLPPLTLKPDDMVRSCAARNLRGAVAGHGKGQEGQRERRAIMAGWEGSAVHLESVCDLSPSLS